MFEKYKGKRVELSFKSDPKMHAEGRLLDIEDRDGLVFLHIDGSYGEDFSVNASDVSCISVVRSHI